MNPILYSKKQYYKIKDEIFVPSEKKQNSIRQNDVSKRAYSEGGPNG